MSRNDLLESDYYFELKEPKKAVINAIWASLALLSVSLSVLLFLAIIVGSFNDMPLPYIEFNGYATNIIFIATPFLYFIFKDILTYFFCSDKNSAVKANLSAKTEMPVWNYREAFKTWQVVLIHLVPAFSMYIFLLGISVLSGGNPNFFLLVFIMTFFMTSDLTLAIYVLFLKTRYNAEYIAINNHVYSLTLYSMKASIQKKADDLKTIEEKLNRKYFGKPVFFTAKRLSAIKKAGFALAMLGLVLGIFVYMKVNLGKNTLHSPGDTEYYNLNAMGPAIKDYRGDPYSSPDITAGGYYTGSEPIAAGAMIYCNDDSSVIYFDSETDSLMRLSYRRDKPERLCVNEGCRNDLGAVCGHMPNFVSSGCYSDGVLYGAQNYTSTDKKGREVQRSYIIRYDTLFETIDKLIEFEMGDEDACIHKIFASGKYLYAVVSAEEMTQLTVVRVDLEEENACILYSDDKDMGNREKIENLAHNKNYILSSADGVLYLCDPDMRFFWPLSMGGYGRIRRLDANDGDIYVLAGDALCGFLYDPEDKAYSLRVALVGIDDFCIYDGFLYYTLHEKNSEIRKVKLDNVFERIPYMDYFLGSTVFYTFEPGILAGGWNIKNGFVYALLDSGDGNAALSRIDTGDGSRSYVFW